ncbi:dGTP triphosphohydrolase [Sporomusaceae bacterium FL31]|nr:dGTP triphosphohydrolase [Sporomusaceae bacterium FL31]GCE33651.1 dGTP triphosphohydrolase [Sporomusaceae bacterium]
MNRDYSLFIVFYLFALANIAQAFVLSTHDLTVAGALQLITYLLLLKVRPILGFAILVAEILATGFVYTGMAFYEQWEKSLQSAVIVKLLLFMVTTGLAWLMILFLKNTSSKLKKADQALLKLKKYEESSGILTLNEFLYRAEAIHTAMKRRNETGYLITITIVPQGKDFALKTLHEAFSRAALMAVRTQYDIVGKRSANELLLLLQHATLDGSKLVVIRFKEKLQAIVQVPVNLYQIDIQQLPANWEYTRFTISGESLPLPPKQTGYLL